MSVDQILAETERPGKVSGYAFLDEYRLLAAGYREQVALLGADARARYWAKLLRRTEAHIEMLERRAAR